MSANTRKERDKAIFGRFLPEAATDYVLNLFYQFPVRFKIVNGRRSKLGDFRAGRPGEKHQISINGDLNPYSFLITTVHEFAHLVTYDKFGHSVAPHGEEWKRAYRNLLLPVLEARMVPPDLEKALMRSMVSTRASSCSDTQLARALQRYDRHPEGMLPLEKLAKNTTFTLNNRVFRKGELRRNRFLCEELHTKKRYTVNCLALVKPIETVHA